MGLFGQKDEPKFCSICGSDLEKLYYKERYDNLTGGLVSRRMMLVCKSSSSHHDSWHMNRVGLWKKYSDW